MNASSFFEPTDAAVVELEEALCERIIKDKQLDLTPHIPTLRHIYTEKLRLSRVREIVDEWLFH